MAFRHVLVPTDFSEPANHALSYAAEEAAVHRAKVTLLHVQPTDAGTDVYYVAGAPASELEAGFDFVAGGRLGNAPVSEPTVVRHDYSDEMLTRLRDLVPGPFRETWDVAVAVGRPADTIVCFAQERKADLIVMATHGRTGLGHMVLGSVAEKVVRLARCPVLTVKYTADPAVRRGMPITPTAELLRIPRASDKVFHLRKDDGIVMPAGEPHAGKAVTRFKMLLTMIKGR